MKIGNEQKMEFFGIDDEGMALYDYGSRITIQRLPAKPQSDPDQICAEIENFKL